MSKPRAVHKDATKVGDVGRTALCGYPIVDTETDISRVTCRLCRKLFVAGATEAKKRRETPVAAGSEDAELKQAMQPKAGPPPRLTAPIWAGSCKGGEHRRCGMCAICDWEREAKLWGSREVSAHNREHRVRKPENAPRWGSMAAALVALAEWERHDRCGPSALGGIISRLQRGDVGDGGASRPDDPMLHRAGELVVVRQALEKAYPLGAHATLRQGQCMALLLVRTPGVVVVMPAYEELAAQLGATEGDLRALVRCGKRQVQEDLAERGLIPAPRIRARPAGSSVQTMQAGAMS